METIPCFDCGQPAEHNHHVVPRSCGGKRTVPLCVPCHEKVHGHRMARPERVRLGLVRKRERVEAGLDVWNIGRPKGSGSIDPLKDKVFARLAEGATVIQVAKELGLSRAGVYKWLQRWRQEPKHTDPPFCGDGI